MKRERKESLFSAILQKDLYLYIYAAQIHVYPPTVISTLSHLATGHNWLWVHIYIITDNYVLFFSLSLSFCLEHNHSFLHKRLGILQRGWQFFKVKKYICKLVTLRACAHRNKFTPVPFEHPPDLASSAFICGLCFCFFFITASLSFYSSPRTRSSAEMKAVNWPYV